MKKTMSVVFILAAMFSGISFAQERTAGDYFYGISTKLGRGLENVVTSPAEIPCGVATEMHRGDPFEGFFSGFGKGTVFFLRRVLVGVTEIGSFMIPMERTIPSVCKEYPAEVMG